MKPRVGVRPARRADLAAFEAWLSYPCPGGERPPLSLRDRFERGGLSAITTAGGGPPVGVLEVLHGQPKRGWARIELLALAPKWRRRGYGAEAVRLYEERSPGLSWLAEIDALAGLALYFWLRLGYRPARPEEVFWRAPDAGGIIAMVRTPTSVCTPEMNRG